MNPLAIADTNNVTTDANTPPATNAIAHPSVRAPIDARGLALGILATVALVWALRGAQDFFVSLLLGIIIAYTLNPLVVWLERITIPRALGTTLVMVSVLSALGFGAYSLRGQAQSIVDQLPTVTNKVSRAMTDMQHSQRRNMKKVQNAARAMQNAAAPAVAPSDAADAPTHVIIDAPAFKLDNFLWAGSVGVLGFLGQAAMVIFLVFFLLLTGDIFKHKLVRIAGPSLAKKKITLQILDDINQSIQRYMLMLLTTNVLVGVLSWAAFRALGLENAGAWAVAAGVFHLIPYFGPALTAVVTAVAAFVQFGTVASALWVAGASLAVAIFVGTFVATWMTGRIAKMNTAAVFISLLFGGWLWGMWGMLLSIPIIVIVKVVSQQVEDLHPLAELLSE